MSGGNTDLVRFKPPAIVWSTRELASQTGAWGAKPLCVIEATPSSSLASSKFHVLELSFSTLLVRAFCIVERDSWGKKRRKKGRPLPDFQPTL
jgi:hypothetical protein